MIYLRFEVWPSQAMAERDGIAGGFANCWFTTDESASAEARARQSLAEQGWTVVSLQERRIAPRAQLESAANAEMLAEAELHGSACIIHAWPAEDAAAAH
jgi:hypothetical protein